MSEATSVKGSVRRISERDIALSLVMHYAEDNCTSFSLIGFYDDDFDFLQGLAERLHVPNDAAFKNKLARVVRVLVNYGVLYSRMSGTSKEYIDEPAKQMNYWLKPGKANLIRRGKTHHAFSCSRSCPRATQVHFADLSGTRVLPGKRRRDLRSRHQPR